MKLVMLATVGLTLTGACTRADDGCDVLGGPADVQTQAGRYDGYDVAISATPSGGWSAVVTGSGSVRVSEWPAPAICELVENLTNSFYFEFQSIQASSGTTQGCAGWTGVWLYSYDWRDVDEIIALGGAWFRERDYQFELEIEVGAPFCALAAGQGRVGGDRAGRGR